MEALVKISKAFSDLNRLRIVALIQRESRLCVCELCDTLKLSQPLVSRHLKQLKAAGILESFKEGKWMLYALKESENPLVDAYLRELKAFENELGTLCSCESR